MNGVTLPLFCSTPPGMALPKGAAALQATKSFRVTREESAVINQAAADRGMAISDLIRETLQAAGVLPKEVSQT